MGKGQAEGFCHDLGGGGGAEKLAATTRRGARAATEIRGLGQGELTMAVAGANRLHGAGIFAHLRRQGDTTRHEHAGEVAEAGDGHQHCGQPFVAGGDAQHALATGQRAGQPAEDGRGIVAVRQTVKHPRGALRATITGVRAEGSEGNRAKGSQPLRSGLHEEADFPVAGVIAQGQRAAVGQPDPSLGGKNEKLPVGCAVGGPAHPRIL